MRIAIPAGRMQGKSLQWLASKGFEFSASRGDRSLCLRDRRQGWEAIAMRPGDIPWVLEQGAVDFGLVGEDVLGESDADILRGPALGYGRCRLVVAGPEGVPWPSDDPPVVATKYPRQAQAFLDVFAPGSTVLTMKGSLEIAPYIGLAPYIVDIVQTGRTLRENGLVELEEIASVEMALVASRSAVGTDEGLDFWERVLEEEGGVSGADLAAG